jgi:PTH1 family peptidyl-tRNA hydrolase
MKLIIGLGNPGEKYIDSRHNLGFMVVDALAKSENLVWKMEKKFNAQLILKNQGENHFILVKPQTMMNASGYAVEKLANFYKIKPEDIWIIHDDIDLSIGKSKIRLGGAAAGHHGVESIIAHLTTDRFIRFRLGIGHPGRGADHLVERFVLENFNQKEKGEVKKIIRFKKGDNCNDEPL